MARALRFQDHPLLNRLPSSILAGKSLYEVFHNQVPKLHHLRVFDCLCYATRPITTVNFSPKAITFVFMGYFDTQKGYKLYNNATSSVYVNKDVSFKEDIFPFKHPKHTLLDSQPHHTPIFLVSLSAFPNPANDCCPAIFSNPQTSHPLVTPDPQSINSHTIPSPSVLNSPSPCRDILGLVEIFCNILK